MSLYDDLGVDRNASAEDIKKAFKRKASQHHPDREGGDHGKMMAVTVAYRILSNEEKRQRYDQTGNTGNEPTIDELALRKIQEALNEIFEDATSVTFETEDPIRAVISAAKKGRREVIRRMKKLMKQRKLVQTAIHRLVKNAEKVTPIFQEFIDAVPRRLAMAEREVKIIERAMEILHDVQYETREMTDWDKEQIIKEKTENLEEMRRILSADYDPDDDKDYTWSWKDWDRKWGGADRDDDEDRASKKRSRRRK